MVLSWPLRYGVWSGRKAVAAMGTQSLVENSSAQGNWASTSSEKMLPSSQHSVKLSSKWKKRKKNSIQGHKDLCPMHILLEGTRECELWTKTGKPAPRNRGPIKNVDMGSLREDTVLQSYRATLPFWGQEKMNSMTKVFRMKNYWWVCSRCDGFREQCL